MTFLKISYLLAYSVLKDASTSVVLFMINVAYYKKMFLRLINSKRGLKWRHHRVTLKYKNPCGSDVLEQKHKDMKTIRVYDAVMPVAILTLFLEDFLKTTRYNLILER